MFKECYSLISVNIYNFICPENMEYMFYSCKKLESIDLSSLIIPKRTNMRGLFSSCSSLKSINFTNSNTENITDMSFMFYKCTSLL